MRLDRKQALNLGGRALAFLGAAAASSPSARSGPGQTRC